MEYIKPPLTIAQQIKILKNRGLIIKNEERASRYLSFISFYRLRAYTYPYQDNNDDQHPFFPKITFDTILNTYLFDRKLRLLVFDSIERIEIAFRTQIVYYYSIKYGGNWYEKKELYRNIDHYKKDINILDKEIIYYLKWDFLQIGKKSNYGKIKSYKTKALIYMRAYDYKFI